MSIEELAEENEQLKKDVDCWKQVTINIVMN